MTGVRRLIRYVDKVTLYLALTKDREHNINLETVVDKPLSVIGNVVNHAETSPSDRDSIQERLAKRPRLE
jgi:hypothetical protein